MLQLPPCLQPLIRGRLWHPGALGLLGQHSETMVVSVSTLRNCSPRSCVAHTLFCGLRQSCPFRWATARRRPGSRCMRVHTIYPLWGPGRTIATARPCFVNSRWRRRSVQQHRIVERGQCLPERLPFLHPLPFSEVVGSLLLLSRNLILGPPQDTSHIPEHPIALDYWVPNQDNKAPIHFSPFRVPESSRPFIVRGDGPRRCL